jgi:hypothetical protein
MDERWEDNIWIAILPIYIVFLGLISGFTIWVLVGGGSNSLILNLFFGITLAGMAIFSEKNIETVLWVSLGIVLGVLSLGILELNLADAIQSGLRIFMLVGAAMGAFFTPMIITKIRDRELSAGLGCPLAVLSGAAIGSFFGAAIGVAFGWYTGTINPLHEALYLDSAFPPGLIEYWGWLSRVPIGSFFVLLVLGIWRRHKGLAALILGAIVGLGLHGIFPLIFPGGEARYFTWAWAITGVLMWLLVVITRNTIPEVRDWLGSK